MKKQIFILLKGVLFTLLWTISIAISAQNATLKGTVTDEGGGNG